jgi:two-component system phosphate regulon sensor histidine kinase PhoR
VARDFVSKMNVEVDRLAQMVQEMGDLARIESGEALLKRSPVNIADVVTRAVERLRAQADRAGLQVKLDIASGLPSVSADEGRIEQVLVNLVHNSLKFTPPGGTVRIAAKADGDYLLVSVSDTGVGISADDLPRVFERFYKADRARAGGGTGLGLAIAKHVVEAHDGQIWVESVEGRGATFSFTIPLVS